MRALIVLLAVSLGSSMAQAKGGPNPLQFAGTPGVERCQEIAKIAESERHHPDIEFGWGYVEIELWTHAIGGLSKNDFIMAAKIDLLEKSK